MCAARLVFERFLPVAGSQGDLFAGVLTRLTTDRAGRVAPGRGLARGAILGATAVLLAGGVVAAGEPARGSFEVARAEAPPEIPVEVDPSTLPQVTVDAEIAELSTDLSGAEAQDLAVALAENLEIEAQALMRSDAELLAAADHGARLDEMQRRIDDANAMGETLVERYAFDSLNLAPVAAPAGHQVSLRLGFEARGTVEIVTYDAVGEPMSRSTSTFALTFVLSRPTGDRWLIVGTRRLT
jgi:hypothetical protein